MPLLSLLNNSSLLNKIINFFEENLTDPKLFNGIVCFIFVSLFFFGCNYFSYLHTYILI